MPTSKSLMKRHLENVRTIIIDHPDANTDWGHGVTASQIDAVFQQYGDPNNKLIGAGTIYVQYGNIYKINPAFAAAVTCQETGYGSSDAFNYKNNSFGMMSSNGVREYSSVQEGIRAGMSNLSRNYLNKGKLDIKSIQETYCPIGAANDPTNVNQHWQNGVKKIYKQITGKDLGSGAAVFGIGVSSDPLSEVVNGYNGSGAYFGDGSGGPSPDFDNREDLENLNQISGVILSYLPPHHLYSVKSHKSNWEKDKYDRQFHYGIDSKGIAYLKEDNLIAQSMQDNNKSTYINRALFNNQAVKHCLSIVIFTSEALEYYAVTERKLIRDTARLLHKYNLETKDLWREFDLNRAASPVLYLDRMKWKALLREIDKQLVYLQGEYPQDTDSRYETHIGMNGIIISDAVEVREKPEKNATSVLTVKKDSKYEIIGYSNTWYEIKLGEKAEDNGSGDAEAGSSPTSGWIEVKHVSIEKDFLGKNMRMPEDEGDDDMGEEDIVDETLTLDFPEIDEDKMPEITNILTHNEYLQLLSYSAPMFTDNYAGMHEPYDKNLPEITNAIITDDDRMASMTTTVTSLEENKMYYSLVEASSGDGDHCKRAPAEMNAIWKSEELKVEPIYPDLIIPPKYSTADQNVSDPNALPPGIFAGNSSIADYLSEDKVAVNEGDTDSCMYKISMFDYEKAKRSKTTEGKIIL